MIDAIITGIFWAYITFAVLVIFGAVVELFVNTYKYFRYAQYRHD